MVETICPSCGNRKSFEDSHVGKTFKCPSCKNPVTIQNVGSQLNTEPVSQTNSFADEIARAEEDKKRQEAEAINNVLANQAKAKKNKRLIIGCLILLVIGFFTWKFYKYHSIKNKVESYIAADYKIIISSYLDDRFNLVLYNQDYIKENQVNLDRYLFPYSQDLIREQALGYIWRKKSYLLDNSDDLYTEILNDDRFLKVDKLTAISEFYKQYGDSLRNRFNSILIEDSIAKARTDAAVEAANAQAAISQAAAVEAAAAEAAAAEAAYE